MKIEYPKWLYHPIEAARLVNDPHEQAALGDGWQESPVFLPPTEDKVKRGKK